ncbi:hypothetical protein, partial [Clostridium perfringens]
YIFYKNSLYKGGETLAIEAIKEIKKVELQADEMIKKAHEQSKKIISDATIEADERYNSIIEEAKNVARGIVSNAEEAGRKEAEVILSEGEKQCAEVSSLKGSKIDSAVNLVIERIVKTNGNS